MIGMSQALLEDKMGKDRKGRELGEGLRQRVNGKYEARFVDRFGKRISIYGDTLQDVRKKRLQALAVDFSRKAIREEMTLDQWYYRWLEVYKRHSLRQDSLCYYKNVYEKNIEVELGNVKLTDITKSMIQDVIKKAHDKGYGYERQNKIRIMLSDMFDRAIEDDLLLKNPAKGVRTISKKSVAAEFLTQEEQREFCIACSGTFYENAFMTQLNTGLRPGELYGLKEEDIDFDGGIIRVRRTLVYQKYEEDTGKTFHEEEPKTPQSIRDVPMNSECRKFLQRQVCQKRVVASNNPDRTCHYLFVTGRNSPLNASIYNDAIKRIVTDMNAMRIKEEQLPYFSAHCFRHTFATRCFEAGVDAKVVQKFLGHASIKMTMDLYTHVVQDKMLDSIEMIVPGDCGFDSVEIDWSAVGY